MDKFSIDSHKLMFHPDRVAQWVDAKDDWEKLKKLYPIYLEITPLGACNHRCTFCSVDYLGYEPVKQDKTLLSERIREFAELGVKSIMFAGEGEPSLWKPLPEILDLCSEVGIDTSMTTNMVPFTDKNTDGFVRNCKWIKVSINAGNEHDYEKIHQTNPKDFNKVINNFARAVSIRNDNQYECTLGGQMLLLPENEKGAVDLAKTLRDTGADYLVIKPYTQSKFGLSREYEGLRYDDMLYLEDQLKALETDSFKIVFRINTMNKLNEEQRPYRTCYSTPNFWAYIMANGDVYSCGAYLADKRFRLGNINEQSFREIWEGKIREKHQAFITKSLDISECRINCRMDEVNRYLWALKNPGPHVNFI